MNNKRKILITVSILAVFIAAIFFVSCGGSGDYEKPSTTQTGSALISASTLKAWIDEGKVNSTGYDRVVILDLTSYGTYTQGHIPGALFVDSGDIGQNRNEGVGASTYEVLDGSKMDELIQKYGIDGNTTIVFTSTSLTHPTRAYATFRYWGFPKSRLKLLDGLNTGWKTDYGLIAEFPTGVARSTYSVKNNGVLRDDLRVSLAEMIDYTDGRAPEAVVIDVRSAASAGSYAGVRGSTSSVFNPTGDFTVFEGRIKGAKALAGSTLYSSSSNTFKTVDELITAFTNTSIGLDSTKTAYLYCVKGAASSVTFFILDGILGWPAAVYDGSWQQWGQLSGNPNMKGMLNPNSPWRTDLPTRSDLVVYNYESVPFSAVTTTASLNLTTSGTFTGATNSTFIVNIDSEGVPDTFSWIISGTTTSKTGVAITPGVPQPLANGVSVTFAEGTGHVLNDTWSFTAFARKAVEQLTTDGSACSATFLANGLTTNSNGGTTSCTNTPNSYDTDVNRIEIEDKAYMNSGGGRSGGGSNSVPAGC